MRGTPTDPHTGAPIRWALARPATIIQAIAALERRLLADLGARERADEEARLEQLRNLLRMTR